MNSFFFCDQIQSYPILSLRKLNSGATSETRSQSCIMKIFFSYVQVFIHLFLFPVFISFSCIYLLDCISFSIQSNPFFSFFHGNGTTGDKCCDHDAVWLAHRNHQTAFHWKLHCHCRRRFVFVLDCIGLGLVGWTIFSSFCISAVLLFTISSISFLSFPFLSNSFQIESNPIQFPKLCYMHAGFMSVDCFLMNSSVRPFYLKTLLYFLAPILLVVVMFLLTLAAYYLRTYLRIKASMPSFANAHPVLAALLGGGSHAVDTRENPYDAMHTNPASNVSSSSAGTTSNAALLSGSPNSALSSPGSGPSSAQSSMQLYWIGLCSVLLCECVNWIVLTVCFLSVVVGFACLSLSFHPFPFPLLLSSSSSFFSNLI